MIEEYRAWLNEICANHYGGNKSAMGEDLGVNRVKMIRILNGTTKKIDPDVSEALREKGFVFGEQSSDFSEAMSASIESVLSHYSGKDSELIIDAIRHLHGSVTSGEGLAYLNALGERVLELVEENAYLRGQVDALRGTDSRS